MRNSTQKVATLPKQSLADRRPFWRSVCEAALLLRIARVEGPLIRLVDGHHATRRVRTTAVMANIEGGECVAPSMRTSVVVTEKSASAELNEVPEERVLEFRDVHDDGVGEPGFRGLAKRAW